MLIRYLKYLQNRGNHFSRKFGYSKELIAIDARYRRNKKNWEPHLNNSRKAIIHSSKICNQNNCIMILGAGRLNDIPINFVARSFKYVYLVDVIFSVETQRIKNKYKNIQLITHDLNGIEEQIIHNHPPMTLPHVKGTLPTVDQTPDLIVSPNILSQLYLAPIQYLEQKTHTTGAALVNYAKEIVTAHIQLLKHQSQNVCLITDYYRVTTSKYGHIEQDHALLGLELPTPDDHWRWDLAPRGELGRKQSMHTLVYAYYNFK